MPVYVYAPVKEKGRDPRKCELCAQQFEIVQKMSDPKLRECPQCGRPIQRLITAPSLNNVGKVTKPSDRQLAQAGFTQYKRQGKGHYEKTFGKGPGSLRP